VLVLCRWNVKICSRWAANVWKVSFGMWSEKLAIDSIVSLSVNLRCDHAVAMCGRRSIDIYSSKCPAFMFGLSHRLSMTSLRIRLHYGSLRLKRKTTPRG
jgi:hypothetical protein